MFGLGELMGQTGGAAKGLGAAPCSSMKAL